MARTLLPRFLVDAEILKCVHSGTTHLIPPYNLPLHWGPLLLGQMVPACFQLPGQNLKAILDSSLLPLSRKPIHEQAVYSTSVLSLWSGPSSSLLPQSSLQHISHELLQELPKWCSFYPSLQMLPNLFWKQTDIDLLILSGMLVLPPCLKNCLVLIL